MAALTPYPSLTDYQRFADAVYGLNNRRHFTADEMLTNILRFTMRGLKGIRKGDPEKVRMNMTIAISWTMSLLTQLGVDLERHVWERFPYRCSYCGQCPCACKAKKVQRRVKVVVDPRRRPRTIRDLQVMFNEIYPASSRTLEHAGIHLAEEIGEFSEAVMTYRGNHKDAEFDKVILEAADLYSCFMGVFNSLGIDYEKGLVASFKHGCHACKHIPCECEYQYVVNFKS
ncbi:MAG TPA: hypothetical protein VEA36_02245 [Candidatus Paceibacterota bacterium]|nr:hypothetical protein [Candidatus Paceibacterota bacterium]